MLIAMFHILELFQYLEYNYKIEGYPRFFCYKKGVMFDITPFILNIRGSRHKF